LPGLTSVWSLAKATGGKTGEICLLALTAGLPVIRLFKRLCIVHIFFTRIHLCTIACTIANKPGAALFVFATYFSEFLLAQWRTIDTY
jgi:hypothetical protein